MFLATRARVGPATRGDSELIAFLQSAVGYPNAPGWCLLALPVPHNVATAACNVALGSHKAVKIKPQPAAAPATATAAPTNTP